MTQHQTPAKKTSAKAALAALNQAYEYYDPLPLVTHEMPAYDDMPFGR